MRPFHPPGIGIPVARDPTEMGDSQGFLKALDLGSQAFRLFALNVLEPEASLKESLPSAES